MKDTICQVCGEKIEEKDIVYCCSCATPHHNDCWDFAEHCSTYACSGTEKTTDFDKAQEKASEPKEVKHLSKVPEKSKKAIELVLHDQFKVNLLQPVVIIQVENGRLVIDNKEGVIRHRSHEKNGPSAFSRIVPMNRLSHTSVVTRHQGGLTSKGSLPDLSLFIPIAVTQDNHLVPITSPWSSRDSAKEAAVAFGRLCHVPYDEMEKSIIAIHDEPTPGWLSRFRGDTFFEVYGKQGAFLLLTLAAFVMSAIVGLMFRLARGF